MREYHPNTPKMSLKDEYIDTVALDPRMAYLYSLNWIQEPFPKGETAIARSAKYSYRYAINILQGRFIKGEKTIKQSNYKQAYKDYFSIDDDDFGKDNGKGNTNSDKIIYFSDDERKTIKSVIEQWMSGQEYDSDNQITLEDIRSILTKLNLDVPKTH